MVTLFLLTVFGLLLGAGIKSRMLKAGLDTSLPWNAGRKWWEVSPFIPSPSVLVSESAFKAWIPRRQVGELGLADRRPSSVLSRSAERDVRLGEYVAVSESPLAP